MNLRVVVCEEHYPLLFVLRFMNIREVINQKFSIREAYYLSTGHYPPEGKCFCPFHDNHRTPAAKVYQQHLICFGKCNRKYDAYDFLSRFRPDLVQGVKSEAVWSERPSRKEVRKLPSLKGLTLNQVIKIMLHEVSV